MSRQFSVSKNYYSKNDHLYKKSKITLKPGVTVLVGCNGIGKTTLLRQLRDALKKENVPCVLFDNLHEGRSHAISEAGFYCNFEFMATALESSEGENIVMNMSTLAARLGQFVKTGKDPKEKDFSGLARAMARANGEEVPDEPEIPKERWILLDAVDSGLSVDNIVELKELLFKTILEYNFGNDIYIVISANEYEMARGEQCFNTYEGKYITINNYEEYRDVILKSREYKKKRTK